MAFNAQFFQLNPTTNLADDIKGGYEAGLGIYKGEHEKKLNDIFSKNINAEGNLNEFNFYREASNAGLNPSQIGQAIDYHNKQIEQKTKIAENENTQRSLGYDPSAAGRNAATYGAPVSTPLPSSESKQNTTVASGPSGINVDKIPETQAEYDKVVAERAKNKPTAKEQLDAMFMKDRVPVPKENPVKIPVAQMLNQPANTINVRAEGKPTNTEEAKMSPDTIAPDVFANKDTRTFTQKFEDSYSKDNSILGNQGSGSDISNPVQYEKMGGNTGYVDQYLAKAGLPNGQAGLDKAFEIYKSSVKAASVQGKDNKIDVFATKADQNRYNAELAEAAKKFYQDVVTGNTTTIAEKVAQENLRIAKTKKAEDTEQHKSDIGGRKAGDTGFTNIIRTRDVSKEEKTVGDRIANSYQDFLAATKEEDPSIKGFQMSLAAAKANGNVNKDVIAANMVASGTIPNALMIGVRNLMSDGGDINQTALKAFLGEFGSRIKDPNEKWVAAQKANMRDQLKGVGYDIQTNAGKWAKGKGNPAPKKTEKKEETREEKLKRLGIK